MNDVGATEPQSWHFVQFWGSSTFGSHFYPLLIKTQWGFLWQNWPPWWVVSRSGVTSVGGYFCVCPNLVLEFFGQNFFWLTKILEGGTFTFLQKWPRNSFPTLGGWGTKIWKLQNVMKHPDMHKFLTYEHSLLTILGPKVLAKPTLAAILTQLHLLPRPRFFTEASYFVLIYLCIIWWWYLEWCRSHRASKLAFCSILGLINLWKLFLPTFDRNTMGVPLAKLTPLMSSIQIWCHLSRGRSSTDTLTHHTKWFDKSLLAVARRH